MSEAMQRRRGQMPAWLVFSGVAIGVVGASVKKHAESVGELVGPLGSRISDVAVAVALGHWGSVVILAGAVVVLAGLAVIAPPGRTKQRCAMDRRRCSAACHGLTRLPPCPEPSRRVSSARAA